MKLLKKPVKLNLTSRYDGGIPDLGDTIRTLYDTIHRLEINPNLTTDELKDLNEKLKYYVARFDYIINCPKGCCYI